MWFVFCLAAHEWNVDYMLLSELPRRFWLADNGMFPLFFQFC